VVTPRLALKQKPDAAFEKLYRQHVSDVYRYTLAVLGNPADAEDVTQTTFMNAYRAFHAGERPRKPTNWLRTIAHNVCRQRWRQAARRPLEVAEFDVNAGGGRGGAGFADDDEGPSAADITRALQSLPFNQRTALVMRELEGRRQAEIARELDLSESAVEALLFRARRAMREQLESSITCGEAARAISRQLDRSLSREEQAGLRAHLRECEECATFARQTRAQRGAFKALGAVPVPIGLLSWSGGGSSAASSAGLAAVAGGGSGAGVAAAGGAGTAAAFGLKVAAGIAAVALVAGGGEQVIRGAESSTSAGNKSAEQREGSLAPPIGTTRPANALGRPGAVRQLAHIRRAETSGRQARGHGRRGAHRVARTPGDAGARHTPVMAHGSPTTSGATPATSNGNATRAHGNPAQSNGNATRAHGNPAQSNGTPTRAHGSPAHSNATTPPAHLPPQQSNGTPTRAHGTPPEHPQK
jgi:RNA polymerase sigma factor (sigma-70 family)